MDEGGFVLDYWTPTGTSLPETDRMVGRIEKILSDTPEVLGFARRTGAELGLFATPQNTGDIVVRLRPRSQRSRSSEAVVEELRATFEKDLPGMTVEFVQLLQDMLGDLEGNPEPIEVKIFGDDLPTLAKLGDVVAEKMKHVDGVVDIVAPQRGNPEMNVQRGSHAGGQSGVHRGSGVEPAGDRAARQACPPSSGAATGWWTSGCASRTSTGSTSSGYESSR